MVAVFGSVQSCCCGHMCQIADDISGCLAEHGDHEQIDSRSAQECPSYLFIVIIVHHVAQKHWCKSAKEGPQHARLHSSFAEGAPELARLQSDTLISILQASRQSVRQADNL